MEGISTPLVKGQNRARHNAEQRKGGDARVRAQFGNRRCQDLLLTVGGVCKTSDGKSRPNGRHPCRWIWTRLRHFVSFVSSPYTASARARRSCLIQVQRGLAARRRPSGATRRSETVRPKCTRSPRTIRYSTARKRMGTYGVPLHQKWLGRAGVVIFYY